MKPTSSSSARMYCAIACVCLFAQSVLAQVADPTTMNGKIMPGYQGWFFAVGDGNDPSVGWRHWSKDTLVIGPDLYSVDLWPEVSEYPTVFPAPGVTLTFGGTAQLYSAITPSTVDKHFEWMKNYGIDGVYLQRFLSETYDEGLFFQLRNTILENVRAGANTHGRVWALEYDISGSNEATLYQEIVEDWIYLSDTYNLRNDPRYLWHNGKPVIVIWGLGYQDRPGTPTIANQIIDFFKNDPTYGGCFCMGGVPGAWRTLGAPCKTDPAWNATYRSWHCINPWTVGAYNSSSSITTFKNNYAAPDVTECNSLGIVYLPVMWPGFSWDNLFNLPPGTSNIDRRNGQHLWDQAYAFLGLSGVNKLFVANFDECDEGTAIFKISDNVPNTNHWIGNNGYPQDWYMRLAGSAGQMARGEISLSGTIPIDPYTCGDDTAVDLGTTDIIDGLTNVQVSDGDTVSATIGGRNCRKNVSATSDNYFYFAVNDAQSFQGNCPDIWIRFDYYNSGSGSIQLQYDSIAGGAYKAGPSVTVGTNNTWKVANFHITDAYFGNRQNGGADFRFFLGANKTRHIDVVRVANRDPVGIFTATPTSGNAPLLVNFNGTASYDPDGSITLYSWAFGDGGTATGSTTSHTYTTGGNYTASFTVRDNQGRTDTETVLIAVSGGSPPGQASNPNPANGATGVSTTADLTWTAGSGATSHDVRFGTSNPPPFVINQTSTTYDPGTMANGTTYYWRIDEVNGSGTTTGPVWSFTTSGSLTTFSNSTFASSADGWNIVVWKSGPYSDGTMAFDGTTGNPAGSMKSTGSGGSNNTDSCTREGGEINKIVSTVGYTSIVVDYDVRFSTDQTGTTCTGSCTPLEGDCADKLAVYYSTAGGAGPWTLSEQVYASSVTQGVFNTRNINLSSITAANQNANFALRFRFQFNTSTDSAYLDNIKVSGVSTTPPPAAPTVTGPANGSTVTSLTPTITWTGDAHDGYQVRVSQQNDSNTSTNGWDSGDVTGTGNSAVSGTLRDFSFYYVFVRLRNAGGWGAWSASGYNFTVNTNTGLGMVYLGNSMPTANLWQIYDTASFENGSGITSSIVSDGGGNVWQLFDNSTANRCKEKYTNGMNISFDTGASCAARIRATGITGTPTFNLGISNGNVGGHYLRLYTNEVRLVDNAGNNRGSYLLDATVYHKYHLTVKNATVGSNSTAAWKVYVDGTLQITYTGAGTHEGWDGFFAGHADTTATGTWWFDNVSGRSDGEFAPSQWDPVY